jgi:hypothetical protein
MAKKELGVKKIKSKSVKSKVQSRQAIQAS